MRQTISRRAFVQRLATRAVLIGVDPLTHSWALLNEPSAHSFAIPALDGELSLEPADRDAMAHDLGRLIAQPPLAVLRPASAHDVAAIVRFARQHKLQVAARGYGHSVYGQSQVARGIVIDMRSLAKVHTIDQDSVEVDAGASWAQVVQHTLARGLTPPVLTDALHGSVGGALSQGSIGATSHRYGTQADHVLALQVVTGAGKVVECSPTQQPALFFAVLAGLGQTAIIIRAKLRLVPAPTHVHVFRRLYTHFSAFLANQQEFVADGQCESVAGQVVPDHNAGWRYLLEVASFSASTSLPNAEVLTYAQFLARHSDKHATRSADGAKLPRPCYSVLLPASKAEQYISDLLHGLTLADTGQGTITIMPLQRQHLSAPFLRAPDEDTLFAFRIERIAPSQHVAKRMVQHNRHLFEQACALGAFRLPESALPFTPDDWRTHFGSHWSLLVAAKRRYDPDHILTPGQGIFS